MTESSPEDERALDLLDDYLCRLQAGERPNREQLLREHPELAPALDHLELLEGIASDLFDGSRPSPAPETPGPDATIPFASPEPELPGDFGSYELLEEIGRGGMGVVYKARQKGLDRTVAIKMILAGHLASPQHIRRFQAEARAAAGLRHPHIVDIHEVGQLHGRHYFVMEHVDGVSLAQRIASKPLSVDEAVRLVEQVARAVGHLHRQGIVHRDLKPSNILLDADERPCVTDFGLAKVFAPGSDMTSTGAILGTVNYMAPEQASGHSAEAEPASDVYSLGAILYELLTGRPPFREDSPLDTLMQVLSREPTLPRQLNRHVPQALEMICLKCLSKSPDDRYGSADLLADDLEHFRKGEPLSARPPSLLQRVASWSRREPALAARLSVLGVFLVLEMITDIVAPVTPGFHEKMMAIFAVWIVTAIGFQQLLRIPQWSVPARLVWGALDSALLFAVLLAANGVGSPIIVGYPLLIVASGLWFRVRFVWFTCAMSLVSYGIHTLDFYLRRAHTDLEEVLDLRWDRHVLFAITLVAIAGIVAHLVHRVRVLSSYCGQKF